MHSFIYFAVFAGIVGITTASPTESNTDPTVCAPGTGFFQSCSNGFRGCCKADACTIGYCPDVTVTSSKTASVTATPVPEHKAHWQPETVSDPTVCKPGTGFFQSCSNGFRGCCKEDACTLGYCPPASEKRDETVCPPNTGFFQSCANGFRGCCKGDACTLGYCPDVPATVVKRDDPTVCAPGTGFFQSCSNGFRGCCQSDACTLGYCPSTTEKRQDPTVCAPGTGFFQSCSNGFRGCCKADACTLGYCPSTTEKRQDPTVCAPGTGFFQSCSNGFRGCCKQDACTIGYCPDVKSFETVTIAPKTSPTPTPEANHEWHADPKNTDPTVCAPGTGFFQSCSNGFRGCCKADACTIGYCPSN